MIFSQPHFWIGLVLSFIGMYVALRVTLELVVVFLRVAAWMWKDLWETVKLSAVAEIQEVQKDTERQMFEAAFGQTPPTGQAS